MTIHDKYNRLYDDERMWVDRTAQSLYDDFEYLHTHKFPRGDEMERLVENLSAFIYDHRITPGVTYPLPDVRKLTAEICLQWNLYLDDSEKKAIRAMNRTKKYQGLDATHDFMDFNECLTDAWKKVTGYEWQANDEATCTLIDNAYKAALEKEFRCEEI